MVVDIAVGAEIDLGVGSREADPGVVGGSIAHNSEKESKILRYTKNPLSVIRPDKEEKKEKKITLNLHKSLDKM